MADKSPRQHRSKNLVAMRRTIGGREISAQQLTTQILGRSLGWTPRQTADSIVAARPGC